MTATYKHIRCEEIQGFTVCRSKEILPEFVILATNSGSSVGRVEWMARWKEYEFIPEPNTGSHRPSEPDASEGSVG